MADVTKFLAGIANFQQQHFGENPELASSLASGQKPQALLIGCCDSRVDPALLTDSAPGDLFILRNIANLVPPYQKNDDYHGVSSTIEYAVCILEVLGHHHSRPFKLWRNQGADGIEGRGTDGGIYRQLGRYRRIGTRQSAARHA